MVSTARERDFSRNLGEEAGTGILLVSVGGGERGMYRRGELGGGLWMLLKTFGSN